MSDWSLTTGGFGCGFGCGFGLAICFFKTFWTVPYTLLSIVLYPPTINTSLIEFLKLFKNAITLVSNFPFELNKIGAFSFCANGLIANASAKSSPLAMNTLSLFIEFATFTDPSYLFLPLILLTFLPVTDWIYLTVADEIDCPPPTTVTFPILDLFLSK